MIPPLRGIDEVTHFSRVYQISEGGIRPLKLSNNTYGSNLPRNLINLNSAVYNEIENTGSNPNTSSKIKNLQIQKTITLLSQHLDKRDNLPWDSTGSSAYSPLAYIGPLTGTIIGKSLNLNIGNILFLSRLFSLFIYILIVTLALFIIRKKPIKWIVFITALLPMSIFQASIINPDSLIISESILIFSLYIYLWESKKENIEKWVLYVLALTLIILPLTKPNYILITIPLCFVPFNKISTNKKISFTFKVATVIISTLCLLTWSYFTSGVTKTISQYRGTKIAGSININQQVHFILTRPLNFIIAILHSISQYGNYWAQGIFGSLGWDNVAVPLLVIVLISMLYVIAIFNSKKLDSKDTILKYSFLATTIITFLSILTIFYLTYNQVGFNTIYGIQGRYLIPLIPFLAYYLRKVIPINIVCTENATKIIVSLGMTTSILISILVYHAVIY